MKLKKLLKYYLPTITEKLLFASQGSNFSVLTYT